MFRRLFDRLNDPRADDRLVEVLARVGVAFVLYLAAHPLWVASGVAGAYRGAVLTTASGLFLSRQHFSAVRSMDPASTENLDHVVLFALCLTLTATGPWARRLALHGGALCVLFGLHVAASILRIRLGSADILSRVHDLHVLLPWEQSIFGNLYYGIYDVGLQLWPFLLMLLTVGASHAGRSYLMRTVGAPASSGRPDKGELRRRFARRRARRKRMWIAGGVAVTTAVVALLTWRLVREADPRHVAAHARATRFFVEAGNTREAYRHARRAVAGETVDPQAYLSLATLMQERGEDPAEVLEQGLATCSDPACARRFRSALGRD